MDDKAVVWMGSSKRDLLSMPEDMVKAFGHALDLEQNGLVYPDAKTLTQFKPLAIEISKTTMATLIERFIRLSSMA